MSVWFYRCLIALLVQMVLLALVAVSIPVERPPRMSSSQAPAYRYMSGTGCDFSDRHPANKQNLDREVTNLKKTPEAERARILGQSKKPDVPPTPKKWYSRLWECILRFLRRKRTPPIDGILRKTGSSGPLIMTGISVGLLGTWLLCISDRLAEIVRIAA